MSNRKLRVKRKRSIRRKIFGTSECPRLTVSLTNKHVYLQLVDDYNALTLCSMSTIDKKFFEYYFDDIVINFKKSSLYSLNKELFKSVSNSSSFLEFRKDIMLSKYSLCNSYFSELVAKLFTIKVLESNISKVVFDRNGYSYIGKVKLIADVCRKNGLVF